jgi:uncharacterized protein
MAVTAYLESARVLRPEGQIGTAREFALRTLDRLLAEAWDANGTGDGTGNGTLQHVIAYPDGIESSERAPGTLDDYAFTLHACIDGWLSRGEIRYYRTAIQIADAMIARFYDRSAGAFFDASAPEAGSVPLGALAARRKPLQDAPTPAGNPTAASGLLRLAELGGRDEYRNIAEDTLASFAGIVEQFGLYAGSYGLAIERLLEEPVQIVIVGSGPEAARLKATAVAGYAVNKTIVRLDQSSLNKDALPEALAETILNVPVPAGAGAWALVCKKRTCLPPITDSKQLLEALSG